ncbi:MAG: WD40/YVTN/BNR-like repeat-containing protein [Acidimicrobiales bacterium]
MTIPGTVYFAATAVGCPSSSICFTGSGASGLAKSTDGGRTWKLQIANIGAVDQIDCSTVNICEVATVGFMLRTTNGGANWTRQLSARIIYLGVSCPTASTCGVVTDHGFFLRTRDGGKKWTRHSVGLQQATIVSCVSTSTCEVGGFTQESIWAAFKTTDEGSTWTPDNLPTEWSIGGLLGIQCYGDGTCMMTGEYPASNAGIFTTTDGIDWTSRPVAYPGQ